MTPIKAILIVWMIGMDAAPAQIEFKGVEACELAAAKLIGSAKAFQNITARCVDLKPER